MFNLKVLSLYYKLRFEQFVYPADLVDVLLLLLFFFLF